MLAHACAAASGACRRGRAARVRHRHPLHPHARIVTAVVSLVLLIALLFFRDEFYAEGDPRTRWRAIWIFVGLIVATSPSA